MDLSFHNSRSLLQRVDRLPQGPSWTCSSFRVTGDKVDKHNKPQHEDVELWHRDPNECIRQLLENPAFRGKQNFSPYRVFRKPNRTEREYSEAWTSDRWWTLQVSTSFTSI